MRPSPVICWLDRRITVDWRGQEGDEWGGVTWGPLPSGIKPLFFITAAQAAGGYRRRTSPFPHLFSITRAPTGLTPSQTTRCEDSTDLICN